MLKYMCGFFKLYFSNILGSQYFIISYDSVFNFHDSWDSRKYLYSKMIENGNHVEANNKCTLHCAPINKFSLFKL